MTSFKEFREKVLNVKGSRHHKIKNSYGVYDAFRYYVKNRPREHKYVLTDSQYFHIIRTINKLFCEELVRGEDVKLPYSMGRLEVRKNETHIRLDGEKVRTDRPVDWARTLKLWYEDKESYKNKTLVKAAEKEVYKIYYNKLVAKYVNKSYYTFLPNRALKIQLKCSIKEGTIDAFNLKK